MRRIFGKLFMIFAAFAASFLMGAEQEADLYKQFQPTETSRRRETIEWTIFYMHDTNDQSKPRLLLIGDSICNGYQSAVHHDLGDKASLTYWAGSKCVTDPQYFEELNMVLSNNKYDVITFNNGLHSISSDRKEWEYAYRQAVLFIRAKVPEAKLFLVTCTPTENADNCKTSKELGDYAKKIAAELNLGLIDLYQVTLDGEEKEPWTDGVHFKRPVAELQGKAVAEAVLDSLLSN